MAATFVYSLAGGILTVLATGRTQDIAWKFMRLMGLLVFAPVCLVLVWQARAAESIADAASQGHMIFAALLAVAGAAVAIMAPIAQRHGRSYRLLCALGGAAGLTSACLMATSIHAESSTLTHAMITVNQIGGGIMVGSITVAWLLGHAYLTATKMTIAPLKHFSKMLNWAIGARIAFAVVSLGIAWWSDRSGQSAILASLANSWLIVSLRVSVGLVAIAIFSYMVWDCVRLRSTQSATGILYFGSVFAYVGELASQELVRECAWPI